MCYNAHRNKIGSDHNVLPRVQGADSMCKMTDQYADKIKGQFSFFDRMIINGYFRPLISEKTRIGYLYSMGIPLRGFTEYFRNITDRLMKQIESSAEELGRPVACLPSAKERKENIAKDFLLSDPVDEGLICVLKTLEACRTAKAVGGGKGNTF